MRPPRSALRRLAWLCVVAALVTAPPALRAQPLAISTQARAVQPGELVLFTVSAPPDTASVAVEAFGRTVHAIRRDTDGPAPHDVSTWLALAGIDLSVRPGPAAIRIVAHTPAGDLALPYSLVVDAKSFPTRRLKVDPALVEPPTSAIERIKREVARINEIYASPAATPLWTGPFLRPVGEPANSRFGSRSILNGRPGSPHAGADFLSPSGTPIKAPNAGRIRLAEDQYFSGNTVILDHGLGLFSVFAHLSAFQVHEGDVVQPGDVLGLVGATGRVTGPHLHWAIRVAGARVDPLSLLAVLGADTGQTGTAAGRAPGSEPLHP